MRICLLIILPNRCFFNIVYTVQDMIITRLPIPTHTNTQFTPQQNARQQTLRILSTQTTRNLINPAVPFFSQHPRLYHRLLGRGYRFGFFKYWTFNRNC